MKPLYYKKLANSLLKLVSYTQEKGNPLSELTSRVLSAIRFWNYGKRLP